MTTFGAMGRYGVVNCLSCARIGKTAYQKKTLTGRVKILGLAYTHIDEIIAFEIVLTIILLRRSTTTSTGRRQGSG